MKVAKSSQLLVGRLGDPEYTKQYVRNLDTDVGRLVTALQGRVSFGVGGDGNRGQNVEGEFQQFTSDATPDTEFSVTHGLGSVPLGALVLWQDKAGSLYQGPSTGTAWDGSTVYFKCDVGSVEFLVFLVKKGQST